MSDPTRSPRCPQCGSALPSDAPQGLCPQCLLGEVAELTEAADPTAPASSLSGAPSLVEIAAAFPQLEILELIGQGGMGCVYKARQPRLERLVALKILSNRLAGDAGFRERFTREGRMLARLNHPNIVSVFDFGEAGGFFYLIMEFVDGVNLRQAMRAGRFTLAQALTVVPKICDALAYAHGEGILHRDIKPENILLDTKGRVKIADFGIAKLLGETVASTSLTATGSTLGTPHYMAPEQIEQPAEVDHRADIYSLGVVFYEMLTGELPLGRFGAPSERTPLDPRVDEVVLRALHRQREHRQQSAGEVKTQVENLSSVPPPAAGAATRHVVTMELPAWSVKAILSALLAVPGWIAAFAGAGLVMPQIAGRRHELGVPDSMLLAAAGPLVMCLLPSFVASLLGWLALRQPDVRDGSRRGSWLAAFGLTTLPTILLQAALFGLGASLPVNTPIFALLALPVGSAAALWCAARHHRTATGRSAAPWPGRFAWTLAVFYAFGLLFVMPLVGYRMAQAPREGITSFESTELPEGAIEVVGVAPHPSTGQTWWQADGSPAAEGPFLNDGSTVYPQAQERAYEFVFRTRDLPAGASLPKWRFEPAANTAGGGHPELPSSPGVSLKGYHLVAAALPADAREVTIRAGIAAGPWETITSCEPQGRTSAATSKHGIDWHIAFGDPLKTKEGALVLHVAHPQQPDWQMRVVAVNAAGEEVTPSREASSGAQITAHFKGLTLPTIKEFRFQARRYDWAEFRNVSLAPRAPAAPKQVNVSSALHEESIRLAGERLRVVRERRKVGVATSVEEAVAVRDFAMAEARGDAVKIAEAKITFAEEQLKVARAHTEIGLMSAEEITKAEVELNAARQELARAGIAAEQP